MLFEIRIRIGPNNMTFCNFFVSKKYTCAKQFLATQPGVYNISSDETGRNLTFGLGQEIKERKDYTDIRELRSLIRNIQVKIYLMTINK